MCVCAHVRYGGKEEEGSSMMAGNTKDKNIPHCNEAKSNSLSVS